MITITDESFNAMRLGATLIEADPYGEKLISLSNGLYLKFFRQKRLISSTVFYPYAQRFADNCKALKKIGILCPEVHEVFRIPSIGRDAVLYEPLSGQTIRQLIATGIAEKESEKLRESIILFIGRLHSKGVYFRSLHLGNIVKTSSGELGLIDVADMKLRENHLGWFMIYRNLRHLKRYRTDWEWLKCTKKNIA